MVLEIWIIHYRVGTWIVPDLWTNIRVPEAVTEVDGMDPNRTLLGGGKEWQSVN